MADAPEVGGFSFEFTARNKFLTSKLQNSQLPTCKKTGTTIAGIIFKDGVVLGADTRATEGSIVADKNCEKIHYLAPNIFCCGAGTSADCEHTTELMASNLALHRMNMGREVRVTTAVTMLSQMLFRYQGHVSAALVVGGVDCTGAHLYTIHPHGSVDKLPYVTMGSGSLAAMAVFEAAYAENLDEESGKRLVRDAIAGGIFNDLGSGSNCDITVIRKGSVERFRNIDKAQPKYHSKTPMGFARGNTAVLREKVKDLRSLVQVVDAMAQ